MRIARPLLPLVALIALAPGARAAGGVSLRWNSCYGDGGVQNNNFACDRNVDSQTLVCSFTLGANLSQVSGNEIVLDLAFAGPTLPQWWAFRNPGTCRMSSMTVGLSAPGACVDWSGGLLTGGIGAYNIGQLGPNTSRVVAAVAVPPANLQDLVAGQEYFSFSLTIDNQKTIGISTCAGCLTPGCLLLRSIKVTTPVLLTSVTLEGPANGVDSDWATWRGGGSAIGGYLGCPAATPTAKRTWGAVKALYH